MLDVKVANGDIVLDENNNLILVDSVGQAVYITFSVWLGDWFYDLTFGIDYPNLKEGLSSKEEVDMLIKSKLLSIPGVVSITQFTSTLDQTTRFYNFEVVYKTTDSETNVLRNGNNLDGKPRH